MRTTVAAASRSLLVAVVLAARMSGPTAQEAVPMRFLEPVWGSPAHCHAMLDQLNQSLAKPRAEDLVAAGRQLETGECVARNEMQASQFYAQAARRGNPEGARRMAVLFGWGRGVPQSYANAGAWLAGKGDTEETIEPWDYSVGYAYTLIATALDRLRYPQDAWPAGLEMKLAVEVAAQQPGKLRWRFIGDASAQAEALRSPLAAAFDAAAVQAIAQLAPPNSKYLVAARVTLPIAVRRSGEDRFVVTEQDPLLR